MSETVHRLIINPRSAKTRCGIRIAAYYPGVEMAAPVDESLPLITVTEEDAWVYGCARCALSAERNAAESSAIRR